MNAKPLTIAIPLLLVAGTYSVCAQAQSEVRPVAHFSRLSVGNGIDVYLTQSTEESLRIEVEGEDIDLEDVISEVEGDVLKLSVAGGGGIFSGDRAATAHVSFVQLSEIQASGGSDITSRNDLRLDTLDIQASGGSDVDLAVEAQGLEITVSGGSDVELSGATQSLAVTASGGSDVSAEALETERANVSVSGGSDAAIRASAAIVLNAQSGSDVVVYGNPAERTINNDRSSDVILQ